MGLVPEPRWRNKYDLWLNYGAKNAGRYELIDGKFIAVPNRRKDIASEDMIGVGGIKAVMDNTIKPDFNRFQWTNSDILGTTGIPNAESLDKPESEPLVRAVARRIPLCFAEGDELMEGLFGWTDPNAPHFRWFYSERATMYAEKELDMLNFATYGSWAVWNGDPWETKTGDGSPKPPNHPFFKKMVANREAARESIPYFSLFEPLGIGAFIKHYADQPMYASRYYNKAFAAERMSLGMGAERGFAHKHLAYIDWPKIEGLPPTPAFNHSNFTFERTRPDGSVVKIEQKHPHVDFDWQVGNIFCIGLCRTAGYVLFDERDKYFSDPAGDDFPPEPLRGHDAGLVAGYYYNQCHRTEGKPWQYSRYRFKNSEQWIEPQTDGTTILEHASAFDGAYASTPGARRGRPDAMFRVADNAVDAWGFDASRGKGSHETIILNPVGDFMIEMELTGCKLALHNETI